jgi:hypothetical protein
MMINTGFQSCAVCAVTALLLSSPATAAPPESVYACLQEGHHMAKPPVVPVAFDIKECTSFSGGAAARDLGVKWCDAAAKSQIFPWDPPPTVTRLSTCPAGARTLCSQPTPGSEVVVNRYSYVISRDGIDKMQQRCETAPPGMPKGKFERF